MPRKLKACPACKSTNFTATEVLTHKAEYDQDSKQLIINGSGNSDCETIRITCDECGKSFEPSQFNFIYA